MTSTCEDIPIVIGEEEFRPEEAARFQVMPFDHQKKIAKYYWATPELIQKAIDNGTAVRYGVMEIMTLFLIASIRANGAWRVFNLPSLPQPFPLDTNGKTVCRLRSALTSSFARRK